MKYDKPLTATEILKQQDKLKKIEHKMMQERLLKPYTDYAAKRMKEIQHGNRD